MRRDRETRGNVSVLVAAVVVVAILLGAALAHFGGAVVEKSRADNAADAAALAAADGLALGRAPADACAAAGSVAADNDARLLTCRCHGSAVSLVVEVTVVSGAAHAAARARVDAAHPGAGVLASGN